MAAALLAVAACGPAVPPLAPGDYDDSKPLNPRLSDGRPIYLGFDSHHPDCFAFHDDGGAERQTEVVDCPPAAVDRLRNCAGGLLFPATGGGCACVPASGEDPERVACD